MIFGSRIRLRALEREDLESLFRWWNDPELWTLIGSPKRISGREEVEAWFEAELDKTSSAEGRTYVIDDEEGTPVGTAWFGSYEATDRQATVGLYLGEDTRRGQGLGSDAMRTLVDYLCDELGLHKLRLYVAVDNTPAHKLYRRLGFLEEGRLREHRFYGGKFHDFWTMGLLTGDRPAR